MDVEVALFKQKIEEVGGEDEDSVAQLVQVQEKMKVVEETIRILRVSALFKLNY